MTDTHGLLAEVPLSWQQKTWSHLARQFHQDHLAHAFLVCGAQGLGKSLFVHKFARLILCHQPIDSKPCDNCTNCQLGHDLYHPDILHITPEEGARDIKIEQIRGLSEFASRTSHSGVAKIAIIEHAHQMNISSANALLKTLEEPAGKTYLFLVTELPGFLSATIRSRCQRLVIPTPTPAVTAQWLEGRVSPGIETDHLAAVAGCRPLFALELAESGALEDREKFIARLCQLGIGKAAPQALVSHASKIGEGTAVGYLAATSSILIKYLVTNQRPQEAEPVLDELYGRLTSEGDCNKAKLRALTQYYADVQKARRQLLSGANPNPQLLMESLMWRWSQLV